ncbi:MAG: hypothetical protein ACRD33_00080 [Candidatus Acidiferrales bacterium]
MSKQNDSALMYVAIGVGIYLLYKLINSGSGQLSPAVVATIPTVNF